MSSLADLPEVIGFFSYSREDDEAFEGTLSALRDAIQRELGAQLGRSRTTFRLWQDQRAIAPGKLWEEEIKTAVEQAVFFIPIVTPRAVNSRYCKFEFEAFLARERALGRTDLVFPLLYIRIPALENEVQWREDRVLSIIGKRQYVDWRRLRNRDVREPAVREAIERFCEKIAEALHEPWISPEERRKQQEIEAQQRAEEDRRAEAARLAEEERQRVEAARRAEEEKRRAEAARQAAAKQRRAEAARLKAEEKRRAEAARLAEEEKQRAEAARLADEKQRAETARQTEEEERRAKAARQAEEKERRAAAARQVWKENERAEAGRQAKKASLDLAAADWRTRLSAVIALTRQMHEIDTTIAEAARSALQSHLQHEHNDFIRATVIDGLPKDETRRPEEEQQRAEAARRAEQEERRAEAARQVWAENQRAEAARQAKKASVDLAAADWRTRLSAVIAFTQQMREIDSTIAEAARSALQSHLQHERDNFVRASIINALAEDEARPVAQEM
jgi:hypothetical protein